MYCILQKKQQRQRENPFKNLKEKNYSYCINYTSRNQEVTESYL